MKIILLTPLLQPYRISFYEKLYSIYPNLKVYHNLKKEEDGRPGYNKQVNFPAKGFHQKKLNLFRFEIIWLKGMLKEIKKERPDVIIMQAISGNLTNQLIVNWAKRNKVKVIFWLCLWEPNRKRNFFLTQIKKFIANKFYKKGDYFLTYSSKAKIELVDKGINPNTINIAFNGLELDDYIEKDLNEDPSLNNLHRYKKEGYTSFLYVGGLLEDKRILFLLDAFEEFSKNHKNAILWIVGDGPQKVQVQKRIQQMENVIYFGRIIEGVEKFFIAADFFVLPGTGGLALNQAMFFETPCICGKADGTEDDLVIEGQTGFRFEEDNKGSLISKLEQALTIDTETLLRFKRNGKKIIMEKSNVNNMVSVFKKRLESI